MAGSIADGRRGRRRGELTVETIARPAGVSKPAVSKVLNGRAGVASETRQRVEALLREHGYRRPDAIAPSAILEVVFYGLERHMAVEVMRGVEPVAREHAFTEVVELFRSILLNVSGRNTARARRNPPTPV